MAVHCNQRVHDLQRDTDGRWIVTVKDTVTGERRTVRTRFVFVGAGGGALPLLQRAGIPEISGFGGFPVSGKFLRTRSPELVSAHQAKVYGQAPSVHPRCRCRTWTCGSSTAITLFAVRPLRGLLPKFLKAGSLVDLPRSIRPGNVSTMLGAGATNVPLTTYLVRELLKNGDARHRTLTDFVPTAEADDWDMVTAGQRVQVIKRDPATGRGVLQFGTELVVDGDG